MADRIYYTMQCPECGATIPYDPGKPVKCIWCDSEKEVAKEQKEVTP